MGVWDGPGNVVTRRELLKMARRMDRMHLAIFGLLKRAAELEASIREAGQLFRHLADQLGVDVAARDAADGGNDVP